MPLVYPHEILGQFDLHVLSGNHFSFSYNRVAMAQGKQGIWLSLFPDRENTGNLGTAQEKFGQHGKFGQHREFSKFP